MRSYAILIDGGFVRKKLGSARAPLTAAMIEGLIRWIGKSQYLESHHLHRVYFYDARPLEGTVSVPLNGGEFSFKGSPMQRNAVRLHQELQRAPFVSLRMGDLVHQGWALKRGVLGRSNGPVSISAIDLQPHVQQKGVDMRVGLDIAGLTLKRHVGAIVLVTGDSDFVPAMKFARREGAQLILFTLGHGVYDAMHEHSDIVVSSRPRSVDLGESIDEELARRPGLDHRQDQPPAER